MSNTRLPEICLALDVPTPSAAFALADQVRPEVHWFKVGLELFTAAGPEAVRGLLERGSNVFLDLKLHDIPETMARATAAAGTLGVGVLTIHAAAGQRAVRACASVTTRPRLVAVTRLTSEGASATEIIDLGREALAWGADGLVASGSDAKSLRQALGREFLLVTTGLRWGSERHDHVRVATPGEAARAGADLLVIGRPIRDASDPRAVVAAIRAEISGE